MSMISKLEHFYDEKRAVLFKHKINEHIQENGNCMDTPKNGKSTLDDNCILMIREVNNR